MKKFTLLAATLLFTSFSSFAASNTFETSLLCSGTRFLAGEKNFNDVKSYFPRFVKAYEKSIRLEKDGTVTVDFSDGDQVHFYQFNAAEFEKLSSGKTAKILGTFEDGFYWSNGYNTRAKFAVTCTR